MRSSNGRYATYLLAIIFAITACGEKKEKPESSSENSETQRAADIEKETEEEAGMEIALQTAPASLHVETEFRPGRDFIPAKRYVVAALSEDDCAILIAELEAFLRRTLSQMEPPVRLNYLREPETGAELSEETPGVYTASLVSEPMMVPAEVDFEEFEGQTVRLIQQLPEDQRGEFGRLRQRVISEESLDFTEMRERFREELEGAASRKVSMLMQEALAAAVGGAPEKIDDYEVEAPSIIWSENTIIASLKASLVESGSSILKE